MCHCTRTLTFQLQKRHTFIKGEKQKQPSTRLTVPAERCERDIEELDDDDDEGELAGADPGDGGVPSLSSGISLADVVMALSNTYSATNKNIHVWFSLLWLKIQ